MTAEARAVLERVIRPVHAGLMEVYGIPNPREAEVLSVAIGMQESAFQTRDQGSDHIVGPAVGYWQFEGRGGGVGEIIDSRRTAPIAAELCRNVGVAFAWEPVWRLFVTPQGDDLAAAFARLLVWKDAASLPPATPEGEQIAFDYYLRNWRPGAWFNNAEGSQKRLDLRARWARNWSVALRVTADAADVLQPDQPVTPPQPAPVPIPQETLDALWDRVAALEAWRARVMQG